MEDIAGLAIFLSSRAGAFTVGETITCDGGSVAGLLAVRAVTSGLFLVDRLTTIL